MTAREGENAREVTISSPSLQTVPRYELLQHMNGFGEVTAVTTYLVKRKVEGP